MGTSNHQTYYQTKNEKNVEKLRSLLKEFPRFSKDFFRGIEPTSSINTRIGYAYDLRTFFRFLITNNPTLADKKIADISLSVLNALEPVDIEEYLEYLKVILMTAGNIRMMNEEFIANWLRLESSIYIIRNET